jgi:hypothetical protein
MLFLFLIASEIFIIDLLVLGVHSSAFYFPSFFAKMGTPKLPKMRRGPKYTYKLILRAILGSQGLRIERDDNIGLTSKSSFFACLRPTVDQATFE